MGRTLDVDLLNAQYQLFPFVDMGQSHCSLLESFLISVVYYSLTLIWFASLSTFITNTKVVVMFGLCRYIWHDGVLDMYLSCRLFPQQILRRISARDDTPPI